MEIAFKGVDLARILGKHIEAMEIAAFALDVNYGYQGLEAMDKCH